MGHFNRTLGKKLGSAAMAATAADSLSDVVTTTSAQVQDAVNAVADQVAAAAEAAPAAETPAEAVRVEVVDAEAPETGAEA